MVVVKGFVGLVGSVNLGCRNGVKISTYSTNQSGDIRFEIENQGHLSTLSLTQEQLVEAVEKWLNDDSQTLVEREV